MRHFIIVGQGIAGSLLAWFLLKKNANITIYDSGNTQSATQIASGIINPITGKRFVKSWLIDEALPTANTTYAEIAKELDCTVFHPTPIFKLLANIQHQNDCSARFSDENYQAYLAQQALFFFDKEKINNQFGAIQINGGGWVDTPTFLAKMRNYFLEKKCLVETVFTENMQQPNDCVIWCEGANAQQNKHFQHLPFQLAKGEHLLVQIPDFHADKIISGETTISPTCEKDVYYVGATYEWNANHANPTPAKYEEIASALKSFLKVPYKIVDHKAAIRPTVKDRRPFIGFVNKNNAIFNGMGTKGMSLSPYFADHFSDVLLQKNNLENTVNINRFNQ